jgi:hypothetical protein
MLKSKKFVFGIVPMVVISWADIPSSHAATNAIEPMEAIERAAAVPDVGITSTFILTVKRTDKVGHQYFLDSEPDYRDQRNLSIAVSQEAANDLQKQLGTPFGTALKGKQILVMGTAKRVKIAFEVHGQPTGKFYYQTHVVVDKASQIKIL